jgi:hypothetical protein
VHGILATCATGFLEVNDDPRLPGASRPAADVAQLAEQLFCKQQVRSSSLLVGSQKHTQPGQKQDRLGAIPGPPCTSTPTGTPTEFGYPKAESATVRAWLIERRMAFAERDTHVDPEAASALAATGMFVTLPLVFGNKTSWNSARTRSGPRYHAPLKEDIDRLCPIKSLEVGVRWAASLFTICSGRPAVRVTRRNVP